MPYAQWAQAAAYSGVSRTSARKASMSAMGGEGSHRCEGCGRQEQPLKELGTGDGKRWTPLGATPSCVGNRTEI